MGLDVQEEQLLAGLTPEEPGFANEPFSRSGRRAFQTRLIATMADER